MSSIASVSPSLQSPVTPSSKSTQKCLRVSSRRKLLLSPSKDLLIFFDSKTFTKFNPINANKDQKSQTKLTLDKKTNPQIQKSESKITNSKQNKQNTQNIQSQQKPQNKERKIFSVTNSTESFQSSKKEPSRRNNDERLAELRKQVELIRRKYSYNKLSSKNFQLKKVNSSEVLRTDINAYGNHISYNKTSFCSLNTSKEKIPISILTPKNDRYLSKRILTKNVFGQKQRQKHHTNLRIMPSSNRSNTTMLNKTLKMNTQQSQQMRRKGSFEFENVRCSLELSEEIQKATEVMEHNQNSNSKMFQFTFGSMALMDFQNSQGLQKHDKQVKENKSSQKLNIKSSNNKKPLLSS